ncbi:hypothetical protein [Paraflavitalea speifideaquila]|uniref:hypothetical protein n=1 Tax=Paraflavitalea speifideaquila TaxID=3076558 RepID=UPI0028EC4EAD|nr:hypothetical protein [Paraflavitalea speifideiaquila]
MVDQAKMKEIIAAILSGETVSIDDGIDVWTFDTTQPHENGVMGQQFVSLASNVHQQYLYRRAADTVSIQTPVYLIDERGTALNNVSLSELFNKKRSIRSPPKCGREK